MAELTVQPEERTVVANLCSIFFTALGANDQEGVCSVISPEMKAFLSTPNATKADVITAMEAMHPATITSINFVVNNDYVITKQMDADNQVSYNVAYSVDQHIARTDEGKRLPHIKSSWKSTLNLRLTASRSKRCRATKTYSHTENPTAVREETLTAVDFCNYIEKR